MSKQPEPDRPAGSRSPLACVALSFFLGLPNLAALAVAEHYAWGLRIWLAGMFCTLAALLATRRWGTLQRWGLAPFVFMVPCVMLVIALTQTMPGSTLVWIAAETNTDEISRFLMEIIAACGLGALSVWALSWLCRRIDSGRRAGDRKVAFVLCLLMASPLVVKGGMDWEADGCGPACMKMADASGIAYPFGSIIQVATAISGMKEAARRRRELGTAQVQATAPPLPAGGREIYVLVIGESARSSSFQINGYSRPTTPGLAATEGLLSFPNAASQATVTSQSVPLMLTGNSAANAGRVAASPSLLKVFKSAGFKVYWLSNQQKRGALDSPASVFASDADESVFLAQSVQAAAYANAYSEPDGAILPELDRVLSRKEPRVLLVLHTMGSHWMYSQRYPAEFEKFPAPLQKFDFLTVFAPPEVRQRFANAYDNTVLYTDYVLGRVIGSLKQQDCPALMWYASDHGENSPFAKRFPCAHGTVTEDVIHVPMLVWASEPYKHARSETWAALQSRRTTPVSSQCIFHSLPVAAGITSPAIDLTASIASGQYHGSPRLVLAMDGTVHDFDAMLKPAGTTMVSKTPRSLNPR